MYEVNGVRVGSTLERQIKNSMKPVPGGLSGYHEDRTRFKKLQEKQDLMEAPRIDIKFVKVSSGRGKPKVLQVKTIRTIGIVQLP